MPIPDGGERPNIARRLFDSKIVVLGPARSPTVARPKSGEDGELKSSNSGPSQAHPELDTRLPEALTAGKWRRMGVGGCGCVVNRSQTRKASADQRWERGEGGGRMQVSEMANASLGREPDLAGGAGGRF
jgi:hypothetical protein